ncbi:DUF1707 SHOCT-like domain-containing protein [Petropleomorpha daqingensis]|uniref:DUF1707 domain-containing protein n=1 Tax=Petropleomorpha daqingensis TaxID=2026353 RepID=A0A853CKU1_9ACTN|nr:DUF1707 domain-containing protein [Petropleomorpha daqingensis]NYJ07781.1 hypothetical protein [Petropleomorpha daqingensis]
MGDLQPRMRAGDADRAKAVERLGRHLGEGRLTVEEFDERVGQAHAAVYLDQLPPLFTDLPPDPTPVAPRRSRPPAWAPSAAAIVLAAVVVSMSMVLAVHGVVPIFPLLLLFFVLRSRRWSRRW